MNKTYEGDAILTIEPIDIKRCKDFSWYPESKSFWDGHKREGFESRHGWHRYLASELISGNTGGSVYDGIKFIIKDNIVYYRPHVSIKFIDGSYADKQFDTYENACKYAKEMIDKTIKNPIEINNL